MAFDALTFFSQTWADFKTTGAVLPSSRFLARAMVASLPPSEKIHQGFRILEVGPGTGSFTTEIVRRMSGRGTLDLYEINPPFVARLHERVQGEAVFAPMRERIQIHQGDVRLLEGQALYDAILSGLPLNNFSPFQVKGFLRHFQRLLKPGGALSYFEYWGVRPFQMPFVGQAARRRLRGVSRVTGVFIRSFQVSQRLVLGNVPPAIVRHLRFQ
jgi:phospholipid N-methyltransferase